jgi:hypothetical protein
MNWDDPALVDVVGDTPLRGKYRRLQSWYRQEILGVPPGTDRNGKPIGNLLPAEAVSADPTLNFLQRPELAQIAEDRILDPNGTVEADRLRRNMLSSQPLCVNLFGPLFSNVDPKAVAPVLQTVLHLDMSAISTPRIEWSPTPAADYLNDRTAFDAYFEYSRDDGSRGFVAIETKYTDSFSADAEIRKSPEKQKKYREAALAVGDYDMDRIDDLFHKASSQLFRMALLAGLWRKAGKFDFGICLVAALRDDFDALEAVDRLSAGHANPSLIVRHRSHEELVDALAAVPGLENWATDFQRRYINTDPVN